MYSVRASEKLWRELAGETPVRPTGDDVRAGRDAQTRTVISHHLASLGSLATSVSRQHSALEGPVVGSSSLKVCRSIAIRGSHTLAMSGYKLIYFAVRGRGEAIRLLLKDNGQEYTEVDPLPWDNWVNNIKPKMAFGQVPCLEDGDLSLVQSNAILRYLGRKHDLYGSNIQSTANIDVLNDGVEDLRCSYVKLIYNEYETGKAGFVEKLPGSLKPFENLLSASNAGETGAAVDGKISFVDYNLFDLLDILQVLAPGCLDSFPTLKAYFDKMAARPKIAAYRLSEERNARPINGNKKQ